MYGGTVWMMLNAAYYLATGTSQTDQINLSTGGLRVLSSTVGLYLGGGVVPRAHQPSARDLGTTPRPPPRDRRARNVRRDALVHARGVRRRRRDRATAAPPPPDPRSSRLDASTGAPVRPHPRPVRVKSDAHRDPDVRRQDHGAAERRQQREVAAERKRVDLAQVHESPWIGWASDGRRPSPWKTSASPAS